MEKKLSKILYPVQCASLQARHDYSYMLDVMTLFNDTSLIYFPAMNYM